RSELPMSTFHFLSSMSTRQLVVFALLNQCGVTFFQRPFAEMNSPLSHSGFKLVKRECAFRPSFCCGLISARLLGSRLCEAFLQRPDHIDYSATVRSDSDMRVPETPVNPRLAPP